MCKFGNKFYIHSKILFGGKIPFLFQKFFPRFLEFFGILPLNTDKNNNRRKLHQKVVLRVHYVCKGRVKILFVMFIVCCVMFFCFCARFLY